MALVDYSSDSDLEAEAQSAVVPLVPSKQSSTTQTPHLVSELQTPKKPFQKLLDRSKPSQILVSLPTSDTPDSCDEPPAKRARTLGKSAFSGFNSLLPAPKNMIKQPPKPGLLNAVGLKTGAEAAFSRDEVESSRDSAEELGLPPPTNGHAISGPAMPEEQKPAEEVKFVGKATMFKPLCVVQRSGAKKGSGTAKKPATTLPQPGGASAIKAQEKKMPKSDHGPTQTPSCAKRPPISLFSLEAPAQEPNPPSIATSLSKAGLPLCPSSDQQDAAPQPQWLPPQTQGPLENPDSLDTIADSMNLSAAERRELFGRDGVPSAATQSSTAGLVVATSIDMAKEYAANKALRASGDATTQQYNPIRSIAPGKHSLKQLVNAVQNQRDALEESFAKGKSNQREAAGRYGWK